MFWWGFFAMGHLICLSPETLWNPLSSRNSYIVYTYIVLYSCIKPYLKCIDFYIYTYTECKSQTIYTQHLPTPTLYVRMLKKDIISFISPNELKVMYV